MNGFRVPKSVLKTGLKHAQLVVYLYLLSIRKENSVTMTYAQLATKLSMSQKTAFNAVEKLLERGLIDKDYKTANGKIIATRLIIEELPSEPWVWVERKLFTLDLSSSELNVYLYQVLCKPGKPRMAHDLSNT